MIRSLQRILLLGTACLLALAPSILADCSETEMNGVFLVSGIHDGNYSVDVLAVSSLGEITYPDLATINGNILAILPTVPPLYQHLGTLGNIGLFSVDPADFGAKALVDMRDGQVLFAGTVVWAGQGEVVHPAASTHPWYLSPYPAPPPAALETFGGEWPDPDDAAVMVAAVMDILRATDVMNSFAGCGDYTATAFFYTPAVALLDPTVAQLVVVVQGLCGPPWNGEPVASERQTWGRVKELFGN